MSSWAHERILLYCGGIEGICVWLRGLGGATFVLETQIEWMEERHCFGIIYWCFSRRTMCIVTVGGAQREDGRHVVVGGVGEEILATL